MHTATIDMATFSVGGPAEICFVSSPGCMWAGVCIWCSIFWFPLDACGECIGCHWFSRMHVVPPVAFGSLGCMFGVCAILPGANTAILPGVSFCLFRVVVFVFSKLPHNRTAQHEGEWIKQPAKTQRRCPEN